MGRRRSAVRSALTTAVGGALILGASLGAVAADDPNSLGTYDYWTAFAYSEAGIKICYAASEPIKAEGKYTKRGLAFALVTHDTKEKSFDVVSFVAGYAYKKDSTVLVNIGGKKFRLFTQDDRAWTPDAAMDKALVKAMKRGSRLVVVGTSSRGTRTNDTYSLIGFTKAYQKISADCGAKKKK